MSTLSPPRLKEGAGIRVIAPAKSLNQPWLKKASDGALDKLSSEGFSVSFGKCLKHVQMFESASIQDRTEDLHSAFEDSSVDVIFSLIGGYNSIELLDYLDYDLIRRNPKIFCGYSDITALSNAIYTQSRLICYSGPHFSTFGDIKSIDYTFESFIKVTSGTEKYEVEHSAEWSADLWANDQKNRTFTHNDGLKVIRPGNARGTIVGGNLCTFVLLNGTRYAPVSGNVILFIEEYANQNIEDISRMLKSIFLQNNNISIKGIVVGRFHPRSKIGLKDLKTVFDYIIPDLKIPILMDADFGHTCPMFTFPIGGEAEIRSSGPRGHLAFTKY